VLFSLKSCKNHQTLGALASDLLASGGWELRPQTLTSVFLHCDFFSLHLPTNHKLMESNKRPYFLVIIAEMHQAFGVEKNMLYFVCHRPRNL